MEIIRSFDDQIASQSTPRVAIHQEAGELFIDIGDPEPWSCDYNRIKLPADLMALVLHLLPKSGVEKTTIHSLIREVCNDKDWPVSF